MCESGNNSNNVSISQGQLTTISAIVVVVSALIASITLAVSIITYDRALQSVAAQNELRQRIEYLEAWNETLKREREK